MKKALVGYTGFVGSNIYSAGNFDAVYNSKNIEDAYRTNPDLLIYAGLRAEKYLANSAKEKDMELIIQAEENIARINPRKLVLISTVDVFKEPKNVNESSIIDTENLQAYGYNRYMLELWARDKFPEALIIRLPGLFGKNIKKNFIYDFINIIPFVLRHDKYEELVKKDPDLNRYYKLQDNGFYKVSIKEQEKEVLKKKFKQLDFSALNFTDSRSIYQFYNLGRLWKDIQIALKNDILLWHPATEPISVGELYKYLTGEEFRNEIDGRTPVDYDYQTLYAEVFGGNGGYISNKFDVLQEIRGFINNE